MRKVGVGAKKEKSLEEQAKVIQEELVILQKKNKALQKQITDLEKENKALQKQMENSENVE